MAWFEQRERPKLKNIGKRISPATPEGVWKKCDSCQEIIQADKLQQSNQVCPYCDHHFRPTVQERIDQILDSDNQEIVASALCTTDPLQFVDRKSYQDRLNQAQRGELYNESCLTILGTIDSKPVSMAIMNFDFMGGSMGVVTGEKIALAMELSLQKNIPCIVLCCSGGARMQEGILSLMQMAKTSAVRAKLKERSIPYITVLTNPTTGGCAASFAMLGDIILAEPKALIGFAGPRVIEQSIRQILPEGFQRSEFLLEHGQIDRIVHRKDLKKELSFLIQHFTR